MVAEMAAYLARHAVDPALVELARPVLDEAFDRDRGGVVWVGLDWEAALVRLRLRLLPDGPLPGTVVAPGVARAHEVLADLLARRDLEEALSVELGVARAPEGDLDPGPADPALVPPDQPVALAGLLAAGHRGGVTLEETAAQAGATVAARRYAEATVAPDAASVAAGVIAAEAGIGGDFRLVMSSTTRAVLANSRCPFGPSPPPGLCRFTSALAGTLGAEAAGGAEITLDERLALGDAQCRLVIDLGPPTGRLTSHRYTWPPAGVPAVVEPARSVTRGLRVTLSLQLPRDRLSVLVGRHLVGAAMSEVGVVPDDAYAVELAVTEACANVIDHSGPGDAYELAVTVGPTACHIRVVDVGRGFDYQALSPPEMAAVDAEHGRGVALMHALVDQVRFESEPEHGTVVHLVKRLRFDDDAPARRLMLATLDDPADDG